jgi:flagellar motor switch protein FliN/FliY
MPQRAIQFSDRVVLQFVRESQPMSLSIYWPEPHSAAGLDGDSLGVDGFAPGLRRPSAIERRAATYSRSLLRIRVPVKVTLASKKQPIGRIVELGPGAIIHFDKSCEEMLDLEVGGQTVAKGEPVKVGDKFGIRLTSLASPQERFLSLSAVKASTGDE